MSDIDFQSYLDQYGSDDSEEADPEAQAELEAELYSKIHYSDGGYSDNLDPIEDPTITQNVSVDLFKEFLKSSKADDVKLSKSSEEDSITEIPPVQEEASPQVPLNLSCASDNRDSKYNEAARISQSSEIVLSSDSEDDSGIQVLAEDRSRKRTNPKEVLNLVDLVATSDDSSESEDECVPIFQSRKSKQAKVVIEKDILPKNPKKNEVVIKRQMFNKHFRAASTSSSSTDDDYDDDEDEEMHDLHLNVKGCRSQSTERSFCQITKSEAEAEKNPEQVPKWSKEMNSFYNDIDEEMADVTLQKIFSSLPKNADWTVRKPHASTTTPGRSNRSRYFQGRHCTNCNRPGHNNKVCPEPKRRLLCIMCLEEDSHVWQRCPKSRCFRCSTPGPFAESCRNCRYLDSMVCRICGGKGHVQANCSDKWRRFHATTSGNQIVKPTSNIHKPTEEVFCPNCGKQGHLVHQCRHYSFSCIPPPKTTVVSYSEPLKFKEKETIVTTASESKSAKKRRLREELKASKRAYLSLPNTPKQKFATKMAISKPVTPFVKSSLENDDDVSAVLNEAKTTLECLLEGKKNGKNKKRQKKWAVTLPMESDEPLDDDENPNGTPQFIGMLKQKLAKVGNATNPESSAVKNKIKKEMRMLKKFNPSTIGPKKKRKLMNLMNRI